MTPHASTVPSDGDTIAELRELYRAAEARAARLRLLSVSGREMAEAEPDTIEEVLSRCADRLAFFAGCRAGSVKGIEAPDGIAIPAPGQDAGIVGKLVIDGLPLLDAIPDHEDRETFRLQLEMMGTTINRINNEQERSTLLCKLQEREKTLEILLEKIFTAQEEERRRVSHELHDGVAQTATALARLLEASGNQTAQTAVDVSPVSVARGLVSELRRVIAGLRPTLLDDLGLLAALQSLADGLDADGYCVRQIYHGDDRHLSNLQETALFRVAQEAITNIYKHAGGPCDVTFEVRLSTDELVLRIDDKGRGPSEKTLAFSGVAGHNVGIDVMRERMLALGGKLNWRGGRSGGVSVEAILPAKTPS